MSGQSGTTERGSGTLSTQFMKTATARLPHGTSDLVFAVSRYPAQPDAPIVQLPNEDKPLAFEPVGQNGGHRVTGAPAELVFKLLTQSTPLSVRYKGDMGSSVSTDVTHQGFEAARIAFESCVAGLSPASK